ncbi:MAG: hypothetical protein GVY32_10150 [Gammaproteobacteria bacterium]|jgi:hypothetical protein|nr:hypothetical protein [Gammaproteobacteria bacterium]
MNNPLLTTLPVLLLAFAPIASAQPITFEADRANASFGFGLREIGDIDDDGFADFAIGAHKYSNGQTEEGVVFVYLGSAAGLSTTPDWEYESNLTDARLGVAIAGGDLNGDGIDDLAVGALGYEKAPHTGGAVLVFFGESAGLSSVPDQIISAGQAGAFFGRGLAIPGDLDADGFDDLAVGAPEFDGPITNSGRAYLFPGSASGAAASPSWFVDGASLEEQYGFELAGLGDVNGDGLPDLGVTSRDGGSAASDGHAEVFHGNDAGLSTSPSATLELNAFSANTGWSIAGGDFDGDGYSDVALGSHTYNTVDAPGGVVAIFEGGPGGVETSPADLLNSGVADALFGISAAAGKDLNGDGFDDLLVGAQGYSDGSIEGGAVFSFHGTPSGISTVAYDTLSYGQAGARAGRRVELLDDLDGDGTADIAVSAVRYTIDQTQEGAVFVHTGFSHFVFSDRFEGSPD